VQLGELSWIIFQEVKYSYFIPECYKMLQHFSTAQPTNFGVTANCIVGADFFEKCLKHPACQSLEYIKFRNETTADIP
jgi:hypothetical protein